MARNDDGLGSVVDDDVDAGSGFDRADIATFAADDAAFHLVVRQCQYRHGPFGHEFAGQALDCDRDDSLGTTVGLLARFFLDDTDMPGSL